MDDFGEFYAATKDGVFCAVLVATGDRAGAEDAGAEVFARACARWPRLRAHPNPKAWVLRTALNLRRSWWRRAGRELLAVPERGAEDTAAIGVRRGPAAGGRGTAAPAARGRGPAGARRPERGGRRRWAYAAVAAAVAAVGVLRPEPGPGLGTATDFGERCAAHVATGDAARPALPPLRFQIREDLWIYADATAIVTCRPDGISTYRPPAVQPGGWPFDLTPRVMWPEAPLAWAVGQAPSGTERVEAVLPSGASYRWK